MLDIEVFSTKMLVRRLTEEDEEKIYQLCKGNPMYYRYCPPEVTKESIREGFTVLPPGKTLDEKYYVGYFKEERLIAILDLLDGYPTRETIYIGFFMMEISEQKEGIGSRLIQELCDYAASLSYKKMRLAWAKGNPQAEHFWKKNGFVPLLETNSQSGQRVILAERYLSDWKSSVSIV